MRKSSEDRSELTPEAIIYQRILEKRSGHTKCLGWKPIPNVATCGTSTYVFEKNIGDKYEKLQVEVKNLKKKNVMLKQCQ